jgi:hypothetical protein
MVASPRENGSRCPSKLLYTLWHDLVHEGAT